MRTVALKGGGDVESGAIIDGEADLAGAAIVVSRAGQALFVSTR